MEDFNKDLNDVAKAAKALVLKVEKLQKRYAAMVEKHPRMPARRAVARKAVAKKAAPKRTAAKETVAKKVTVAGAVLAAIGRSKKGVDAATVMKKTGFDKQKVYNTVSLLKKQGKIKAAGRGRYAKA